MKPKYYLERFIQYAGNDFYLLPHDDIESAEKYADEHYPEADEMYVIEAKDNILRYVRERGGHGSSWHDFKR